FIEDDGTVTIHKKSCSVAAGLASTQGDRIVSAKWSKHFMMSYLARISIEGIDRIGVLSDLTRVISLVLGVNMRKLHIETHDEIFEGFIDLYVHNTDDLDKMIRALAKIKGVERVKRVEIN
ncbi:MAG: bifunctional (p)ppGpp synthetase/guanosine-3',5'-bis(diphosphate) 3'-pyrophosphohydrolase, partial [Bacteroidales bacterium]|nr:bifunctional (p)ppGpp synthetase/guanosine-3',5'-bis(diphosphate) 3'-pyrophosphohydrolase [Bacteroidales bacterium]